MRAVVLVSVCSIMNQLLMLLAGLISYCAGCLTCRLAGRLAFAAAAFFHCVL